MPNDNRGRPRWIVDESRQQCAAFTNHGNRCRNSAQGDSHYCTNHQEKMARRQATQERLKAWQEAELARIAAANNPAIFHQAMPEFEPLSEEELTRMLAPEPKPSIMQRAKRAVANVFGRAA